MDKGNLNVIRRFMGSVCLICMLLVCSILPTQATETLPSCEAIYDLDKGGTQEFIMQNPNGEFIYVIVENVSNLSRMDNGTYKATVIKKGYWEAVFYITISNNSITSVGDKFIKVFTGSVVSSTLKKESVQQASLYIIYRNNLITYNTGVRAKIWGKTLKFSEI